MPIDLEMLYEDAMDAIVEDDFDEATELLEQMRNAAALDPRTLEVQGDLARAREEIDEAEGHYQLLLENAPDDPWRGVAHFSLGSLYGMAEKTDLSRHHLSQAIGYYSAPEFALKQAETLTALAILEQRAGNFLAAVNSLEQAHQLIEQEDDDDGLDETLATTTQLLGAAYRMAGKLDLARETLSQAMNYFEALEDEVECADTLDELGVVEQIQGDYAAAEELHMKALSINESIGFDSGLSVNYGNLTMLNLHRKNYDRAAHWAYQAHEVDKNLKNENGIAYFHLLMGEIECHRGQFDQAHEHLSTCEKLYQSCGDAEDRVAVKGKLAFYYRLRGELEKASELNEEVLSAAEEMGFADGVAATLDELAHVRLSQGRHDEAKTTWSRSLEIYKELGSTKMIAEVSEQLSKL
ncbi:MAG: tetratricopeptide repeat protein [Planctomycetota bacterium]